MQASAESAFTEHRLWAPEPVQRPLQAGTAASTFYHSQHPHPHLTDKETEALRC